MICFWIMESRVKKLETESASVLVFINSPSFYYGQRRAILHVKGRAPALKKFYKKTWLVRELWLVCTRVWIRVFKHGKLSAKTVLKFVLDFQSYYFMKETGNGFRVFEYCDSNTWYVSWLSNSFKNSLVFPPFHLVKVASLCWQRFDLLKLVSDW